MSMFLDVKEPMERAAQQTTLISEADMDNTFGRNTTEKHPVETSRTRCDSHRV